MMNMPMAVCQPNIPYFLNAHPVYIVSKPPDYPRSCRCQAAQELFKTVGKACRRFEQKADKKVKSSPGNVDICRDLCHVFCPVHSAA